jgi:DNA-binding IclR family transcriptional regulator
LPVQGSNFVGSRTDLLKQLATAREVGYTTSEDEWRAGVSAAAVPIAIGGEVVASVSIAGPTSRFRASLWVDDLLALAHPLHTPRNGDTHGAEDQ